MSQATRRGSFFIPSRKVPNITMTMVSMNSPSFYCPHCRVLAQQTWHGFTARLQGDGVTGICMHCGKPTLWYEGKLIYPDVLSTPPPNSDIDEDIRRDYEEAASIINKSPRGAAALLRLCVQKLCIQLGEKGKKIDDDIASLVKNSLPLRVQQALDIVRVIGNNAVHPGQIDLKDDRETALKLFALINMIAQIMITQPKEVDALYNTLPQTSLDAIQHRDGTTIPPTSGSSTP